MNNVLNRGYNFAAYDSGYANDFGSYGPASASNSKKLESPNAPSAPGYSYNTNRNYGFQPNQMMSNGTYDRRGDQTFTNFFNRSDSQSRRMAPQGNFSGPSRNINSRPSYDVNWRNSMGRVGASLSTSNQYAGKSFSNMAPQGAVRNGAYGNSGTSLFNSGHRFASRRSGFRAFPNTQNQNRPPYMINRPVQNYDMNGGNNYPMGNGYFSNNLANNFDRRFQGSNGFVPNQGYMPSSSVNTQSYGVAPQVAPGSLAQPAIYTPNMGYSTGMMNMAAPTFIANDIMNPDDAQLKTETMDNQGQAIYNNSNQVMMGAMAPMSSFNTIDELQLEKKRLYDKLLEAVHNSDEESRIKYFNQFSLVSDKLESLLKK